jgi:hypothetical protein
MVVVLVLFSLGVGEVRCPRCTHNTDGLGAFRVSEMAFLGHGIKRAGRRLKRPQAPKFDLAD